MPRTIVKGIRFTTEELARVATLLEQLPEFDSESDLLRYAAQVGLLVIATRANRPGLPQYATYTPDDLAAQVRTHLLPALEFLARYQALPALLQSVSPNVVQGDAVIRTPPMGVVAVVPEEVAPSKAPLIDRQAAADFAAFGTGLMEDE